MALPFVTFWSAAGVQLPDRTPLVANTTYYCELRAADDPWTSIQWKWDNTIVITSVNYHSSNIPPYEPSIAVPPGFYDALRVWNADALDGWAPETSMPALAVPGGTKGNQMVHVADNCGLRLRATVVVGATGGNFLGVLRSKS